MRHALLLAVLACAGCAGLRGMNLGDSCAVNGVAAEVRAARRVAVLVEADAQSALGGVPVPSPAGAKDLAEEAAAASRAALARHGLEAVVVEPDAGARQVQRLFDRVVWSALKLEPPRGVEHPFAYGLGDVTEYVERGQADHLLVVQASVRVEDGLGFGEPRAALIVALGFCDRQGRVLWLRSGGRALAAGAPVAREVEQLVVALAAELGEEP
jgi:hypothetical protein